LRAYERKNAITKISASCAMVITAGTFVAETPICADCRNGAVRM
jgi:hypothetical protein